MNIEKLLMDVVDALNRNGVRYALAGGLALGMYAAPRSTTDIDVIVENEEAAGRIGEHLGVIFDEVVVHKEPIRVQGMRIYRVVGILSYSETVIDAMVPNNRELCRSMMTRRNTVLYGKTEIAVVSLDDLYILKKASSRLQDRSDCEVMEGSLHDRLDWDYIKRWV